MPLNSIPPTTTPEALDLEARGRSPAGQLSTSDSGAAPFPSSLGHLEPLQNAGVFGFKAFLSPSGVDEFPHLSTEQLHAGPRKNSPPSTACSSCTPKTPECSPSTRTPAESATKISWPAAPMSRREDRDRTRHRRTARDRRPGAHPAPLLRRSAADHPCRQGRRPAPHRRDLPALPELRRRGHPRRRDPVQVLPAHPRRGEPRAALAGAGRRRHRPHRFRPLTEHARAQARPRRRLRPGLGRNLGPAGEPARGLVGRHGPRVSTSATSSNG